MVTGIWGRKIGMTQIFAGDLVVPVTAIDLSGWRITGFCYADRDGYDAVQIGHVRKRYKDSAFSQTWTKKLKQYFDMIREVKLTQPLENVKVGNQIDISQLLQEGHKVDVFGVTKGAGFAGVVRRYNFAGAPGSHGSTMGKRPGSIGSIAACGKVIKGKKLPGHMGAVKRAMKNLKIIKSEPKAQVVFVKGSVPGKSGSFVFIRKVDVS